MNKKHVYIVDDDQEIRESLQKYFVFKGFEVDVYADAFAYLADLDERVVGCLVSDIDMEEMNGLALQQRLNKLHSARPTIFITGYASVTKAIEAMKLGAFDFIEKPFDPDILIDKVLDAIQMSQEKIVTINRYQLLTGREVMVFKYVSHGARNKQISESMFISIPTVEAHRSKVMKKMQASSLSGLVKMSVLIEQCGITL
jgi:FixJ family two-component response regulator